MKGPYPEVLGEVSHAPVLQHSRTCDAVPDLWAHGRDAGTRLKVSRNDTDPVRFGTIDLAMDHEYYLTFGL